MITFLTCLTILIVGYFTYGSYVSNGIGCDDTNQTPAVRLNDGVDYMPMPWYKVFLIQFLNIAGTGPIFGAISGALFGPVAFLWITFGTLFAGGVHDYLSGVISMKHEGTSVSEIVGIYLGDKMKIVMRVFSVILLVLVGTVFITSPAGLLTSMTGLDKNIWLAIIVIYYIIATVLPVDKVIGKIYRPGILKILLSLHILFTRVAVLPEPAPAITTIYFFIDINALNCSDVGIYFLAEPTLIF